MLSFYPSVSAGHPYYSLLTAHYSQHLYFFHKLIKYVFFADLA